MMFNAKKEQTLSSATQLGDVPAWPKTIRDTEQLDELLTRPTLGLVGSLRRVPGDIVILGVAGKMGVTLARQAQRASELAKTKRRIVGVARFSKPAEREKLESWGIETVTGDLLDEKVLASLPDAPNVIYMAGMKFGATGNESLTWAMNTMLPALVCRRYLKSRIVAFSTGNIYGLVPISSGGAVETDPLNAAGDYAMSCVGRERIFEHFAKSHGTKVAIARVYYACEMRYGVLVDIAQKVFSGETIDLAMGHFATIWQGDANAMCIQMLEQAASPAFPLNVCGPELLSVRHVATEFGELMGKPVKFSGEESPDAILGNASRCQQLYGPPSVTIRQMIEWIADWISRGGESLGKPTHFEARDGKY